jgi:hypothetical protein
MKSSCKIISWHREKIQIRCIAFACSLPKLYMHWPALIQQFHKFFYDQAVMKTPEPLYKSAINSSGTWFGFTATKLTSSGFT